jgi:hypothetical protein
MPPTHAVTARDIAAMRRMQALHAKTGAIYSYEPASGRVERFWTPPATPLEQGRPTSRTRPPRQRRPRRPRARSPDDELDPAPPRAKRKTRSDKQHVDAAAKMRAYRRRRRALSPESRQQLYRFACGLLRAEVFDPLAAVGFVSDGLEAVRTGDPERREATLAWVRGAYARMEAQE